MFSTSTIYTICPHQCLIFQRHWHIAVFYFTILKYICLFQLKLVIRKGNSTENVYMGESLTRTVHQSVCHWFTLLIVLGIIHSFWLFFCCSFKKKFFRVDPPPVLQLSPWNGEGQSQYGLFQLSLIASSKSMYWICVLEGQQKTKEEMEVIDTGWIPIGTLFPL